MPPFQKKVVEPEAAPEVAPDQSVTLTFAQLKELLGEKQSNSLTPDVLAEIMGKTAEMSAEAMRRSLKPENTHAPGISVFSYPEGDRDKPKPTLPFELYWIGSYPVHKDESAHTWYELEAFATLKPGTFTCSKVDGAGTVRVEIKGEYGPEGEIAKLTVSVPLDRDSRTNIPSSYIWCYQIQHADRPARETFVEAMTQLLQIKLADQKAKEQALKIAS